MSWKRAIGLIVGLLLSTGLTWNAIIDGQSHSPDWPNPPTEDALGEAAREGRLDEDTEISRGLTVSKSVIVGDHHPGRIVSPADLPSLHDLDAAEAPTTGRTTEISSVEGGGVDDSPTEDPSTGSEPAIGAIGRPVSMADHPRRFRDCAECPEMAVLPPAVFVMGDVDGLGDADERPARSVHIQTAFAIGVYEVTFAQWDQCVTERGCRFRPGDNGWGRGSRPVVGINQSDAREFARWLSERTGKTYRLPSEAEWEYAARANVQGSFGAIASTELLCLHANGADRSTDYQWRNRDCSDGFGRMTAPVGSFAPNSFGLHDTIGNAWEWVADCWHESYRDAPGDGSTWFEACDADKYMLRGGAFSVDVAKLRLTYRYAFADQRMPFFGVRVAREM